MEKVKKNKIAIACCVILLIVTGVLFFQNLSLKWQLIEEKAVPDVELANDLTFDSNNTGSGSVTGFVVFDEPEKQPKGLRQYEQITASSNFSEGRQIFYLTDIIKMDVLAPRYFDPVALKVSNIEGDIVTLTDGNNNSYLINKSTKEVSIFDSTRDVTKLITDQSNFRKFMVTFLK